VDMGAYEFEFFQTHTTETPVPVPYSWLDTWTNDLAQLWTDSMENYEIFARTNGANGYPLWESYVADLTPTNPTNRFLTSISISNGNPVITWTPHVTNRIYIREGTTNLTNGWSTNGLTTNFFRVKVGMPE